MHTANKQILTIVSAIEPFDEIEAAHKADVVAWIKSGAPLFRVAKPDTPPKHLVSYFVLYDEAANKLMLVDHIKADAWVPTGGHVDVNENPQTTVVREAMEELNVPADFATSFGDRPLFVTATTTKGFGNHTDVSLWYVIAGDSSQPLTCDPAEMRGYKWLSPAEVLATDVAQLDPWLHRFVRKMQSVQRARPA